MTTNYDAVVVGSGPNGLAAAVTLARAGRSVLVVEGADTPGGACRSDEITRPGFLHDLGSAIHPLAVASPALRDLPLGEHGLEWIESPAALAHPFDDRSPALLVRSIEETAAGLGDDAAAYRSLFEPVAASWPRLEDAILGPLRLPSPGRWPALARFGLRALRSATGLAGRFREEAARGLLAGLAGHSVLALERPGSAAIALVLGALGHRVGWPLPRGGAGRITEALVGCLEAAGGEITTGRWVRDLAELPPSRAVLLDVAPRQLLALAGDRLPQRYRRILGGYRYGPGVFKLDLALDGPIPWRDPQCALAATVHLGGTCKEIAASERAVWRGASHPRPFVLLAQPSLFDASRAPAGCHTAWAYCHVPHGSREDRTEAIEAQIERFAPGFRERIAGRRAWTAADLERWNPNLVGGDITGGVNSLRQVFARPVLPLPGVSPYRTPARGLYLCSASTPPGGGVHGLCGAHAARAALARELR